MTTESLHVGVDIGGTFTDLVAFSPTDDAVFVRKTPTTPAALEDGVATALESLFDDTRYGPEDVAVFAHGSTVSINAVLERRGATTALLHTAGFNAIPVARRGDRPQEEVLNPRYQDPPPFSPQRFVRGVPERIDADGAVVEPLDEAATRETVRELRDAGVDSIAVCFLFSFLNPTHEQRVAEIVAEVHPDCRVSRSSDIAPRIREYPRLSTTAIDAYVSRTVGGYLGRLEERLDRMGVHPETTVMTLSHGGVVDFETAAARPVQTLLSGPAAGVEGAVFAVSPSSVSDVVTMDMGGTSCDIAIAPGGEPETTTETEIDRSPIAVPMIDIRTIGAGGGTIARVEEGRLAVGPRSAGADPGPVCYGRGGTDVTVTDANLVLGRLDPGTRLAGDLELDVDAAEAALEEGIAAPLGLSVEDAASGIVDVVNTKMEKELSIALVRQGHDPRDFTLVPFGGAGPMHAAAIAGGLDFDRVVVPAMPGVTSALGLLTGDRKRIYETSRVDPLEAAPIDDVFETLSARAADDQTGESPSLERELELRYAQELYTISVAVDTPADVDALRGEFERTHRELYGHTADKPLETMTYRVTARVPSATVPAGLLRPDDEAQPAATRRRPVYFDGETVETPVYRREELAPSEQFSGPAIVEQLGTTIVVGPADAAAVDEAGNLVIHPGGDGRD